LFLITNILLSGCGKKQDFNSQDICKNISTPCKRGKRYVEFFTNKGRMTFELNGDFAPLTVGNFLDLVNRGVYSKTLFHRVIRKPLPLVIQGGDPKSNDPNINSDKIGLGSFIEPKTERVRLIPIEIKLKNERFPRYGRLIKDPKLISNIALRHQRGSISMARSQTYNSASSQFFISLKSLPVLDGRYAVFGQIVKGKDILDLIEEGDFVKEIIIIPQEKINN
tara:strand:+ start:652 stop:1320 length:669 start_codon:yes stop_codon:yes gene_type:complete